MKALAAKHRVAMCIVLTLVITSVFALSSFAASGTNHPAGVKPASANGGGRFDLPVGKLIGTGRVTIDGEPAPSGATVLSGSKIATGPDGIATVDLNSLGRIEVSPNTTITLVFSADSVRVDMSGGGMVTQWLPSGVDGQVRTNTPQARFLVTRGQAEVRSAGSARKLYAGEAGTFFDATEALASGDAILIAEAGGSRDKGAAAVSHSSRTVTSGPYGVIALVGLAGGVALGVVAGQNDRTRTALPKPSTVVP